MPYFKSNEKLQKPIHKQNDYVKFICIKFERILKAKTHNSCYGFLLLCNFYFVNC